MRTALEPFVTVQLRFQTFATMPSIESTLTASMWKARAISKAMPNTFSISGNGIDAESLLKRVRSVAPFRIALGGGHETSSSLYASQYQRPRPNDGNSGRSYS